MSSEDVVQIVKRIDIRMWWTIAVFASSCLIGGTMFYTNVEANTDEISKARAEREELKKAIENIERSQILTTSNITHMKEDFTEQKVLLKQMNEILQELRNRP